MYLRLLIICFFLTSFLGEKLSAQRVYAPNSVLATGNWYKIAVKQEGMYKVDLALLSGMGIAASGISSTSIRLFGNGGAILPENNAIPRTDDLVENAIEMIDGGDGIFNGTDYFIFYAAGPHHWEKDSINQNFRHLKNLYTDSAFYYISIGGTGKRVSLKSIVATPTVSVNSYQERYFYENDLVNFLNSGKEWYGEEFNSNLGGNLTRTFTVNWPGLQTTQPISLTTNLAGRSVGAQSNFLVRVNVQQVQNPLITSVTGNFLDAYASETKQRSAINVTQADITLSFQFNAGTSSAQGWLNWFEIVGRRNLGMQANQALFFRDWQSVATGAIANFSINNAGNNVSVWEISNPIQPLKLATTTNGLQTSFNNDASILREYAAFTFNQLQTPLPLGKVANQNLHNSAATDLLIITHPTLIGEAQRLAQFHIQKDGLRSLVVTAEQVFQEFSSGSADPTAVRDFVKMFYDRAGNDASKKPKYLLLFGTASFDYKNRTKGNIQLVPGYESVNSLDPLNTYTSDDFFGLIEDADDINQNNPLAQLNIGIGRIPARNKEEATMMVDKILRYHGKESLGAWRNQSVFVADDRDQNLHLTDAETISSTGSSANPQINQTKLYLDAFPQVSSSGGARYPAVNDAIVNQLFNGTLIFNYSGHGSYQRLAEEAVLSQEELNRFNNPDKLPLFITASCDFAPHDDPAKNSLGAGVLMGNTNGAIALLTTTRLVFAYSNRVINDNYLRIALQPGADNKYLTLGESVRRTKNFTSLSTGDFLNNRKFTLLGDPAMKLAFPELRLQLTSVNGQSMKATDTLKALGKYELEGQVVDASGIPVTGFSGKLLPTVYDKPSEVKTLGNDPASSVTGFNQQTAILYKGNATITNGKFKFSFIMPKDIGFQKGNGRISLYAEDGLRDASGVNTSFYIGGKTDNVLQDNAGPVIKPFLNDDKFQNGGLTHENPVLLAYLSDTSGINTSGNGIGHDITAIIDGNERNVLILNNFYTSKLNSYQEGQLSFPLPTLSEGKHTIRIKAWDVANNSSEVTLDFSVVKQEQLTIGKVMNYPNPFTTATTFAFEHNQPNTDLDVTVNIFTTDGAWVKGIHQVLNTGGTRNCEINWKGDNQSGAKLKKGIYIYKIEVVSGAGKASFSRQLIIL